MVHLPAIFDCESEHSVFGLSEYSFIYHSGSISNSVSDERLFFMEFVFRQCGGPMIPRIVFFEVKKGIESCISSWVQPLWKGRDETTGNMCCVLQVFHLYYGWYFFCQTAFIEAIHLN